MDAVSIDRLQLHYRLPETYTDVRALDALREQVFGHAFEAALEQLGLTGGPWAHEQLCIRELELDLRLDLAQPRVRLVQEWADQLARTLAEVVAAGDSRAIVRYPTMHAALVDMAQGIARGDHRRAWAWRQLELIPLQRGDSPRELAASLIDALLARPSAIVAVVRALADRPGTFAAWIDRVQQVDRTAWTRLADAALSAIAVSVGDRARALAQADAPRATLDFDAPNVSLARLAELEPEAIERCIALLLRSPILRASGPRLSSPIVRRAMTVLACIAESPAAARAMARVVDDETPADGLIASSFVARREVGFAALASVVAVAVDLGPARTRARIEQVRRQLRAVVAATPAPESTRQADRTDGVANAAASDSSASTSVEEPSRADADPRGNGVDPRREDGDVRRREPDETARANVDDELEFEPSAIEPWTDDWSDRRDRETTAFAGLLFLLPMLTAIDAWTRLEGEHTGDARVALHRLGRALLPEPVEADDAVLLAFVGRSPEQGAPEGADDELPQATVELIATLRDELLATLDAALEFQPLRGPALLDWVVRRRAELRFDAGWIEVRLELSQVDTGIRRAGLDLDPDWLPAIGTVMKFVYV